MATATVATATMKVAQLTKPGGEFEVVEREIPKPGASEVLIKVLRRPSTVTWRRHPLPVTRHGGGLSDGRSQLANFVKSGKQTRST
jgi:hypothetical protein